MISVTSESNFVGTQPIFWQGPCPAGCTLRGEEVCCAAWPSFHRNCHLWRCSGMPWLLGIALSHSLVGLPCPLPIFAAASQELRNGPSASSLAGLPDNECRDENLQMRGGKYSGRKQARCTLSCSRVVHMLYRVKAGLCSKGSLFPGCLLPCWKQAQGSKQQQIVTSNRDA